MMHVQTPQDKGMTPLLLLRLWPPMLQLLLHQLQAHRKTGMTGPEFPKMLLLLLLWIMTEWKTAMQM